MSSYPAGVVLDPWPIDLGELRLGRVDEFGGEWTVTAFSGRGAPPPALEVSQRTSAHGAWVAGRWWAAKPYTIDGAYTGETPQDRWEAEQRLNAAVGVEDVKVTFWEETPRWTTCVLNGETVVDVVNAYAFTFQVPLLAPDPFRYAVDPYHASTANPVQTGGLSWPASWPASWDAVVVGGGLQVRNDGTATSYPVFRVHGPIADFTLTLNSTGESLTVDLAGDGFELDAGEWVEVNTRTQTVKFMGHTTRRRSFRGTFFGLAPGVHTITFTTSTGDTGTAEVTGYSTWH